MNGRIAKGFDLLAPIYDGLAQLFIGRHIVSSQLHFLSHFRECKRLLILGGGSGWILKHIQQECPALEIDYIDVSPRMLQLARKNTDPGSRVNFILGTEDDIPDQLYDGAITSFYLDMFDDRSLDSVIDKIKKAMARSGKWVVTDFVNDRKGHEVMLWLMYRFFGIVTRIRATHLPEWKNRMKHAGCKLIEYEVFANGFIRAELYNSR